MEAKRRHHDVLEIESPACTSVVDGRRRILAVVHGDGEMRRRGRCRVGHRPRRHPAPITRAEVQVISGAEPWLGGSTSFSDAQWRAGDPDAGRRDGMEESGQCWILLRSGFASHFF